MDQHNFSIQDAKQLDMIAYLEQLGYVPTKIKNNDYWYRSPLRDEKTASFKINKSLNCWFDFGLGEGGSIIDFGIKYFNCSVKNFLVRLNESNGNDKQSIQSFRLVHSNLSIKEADESKIKILDVRSFQSPTLIDYVKSRSIDIELAKRYCKEVDFNLYGRTHTAIGFNNDTGGFELRNSYFKGSSSPKFTTLICRDASYKELVVFEGFFNFLSHLTAQQIKHKQEQQLPESQPAYIILNSLSFFEMSKSLMERHHAVKLYLDRDKTGMQFTQKALNRSAKYQDCSSVYEGFKDYNDLLTNKPLKEEMVKRIGRRI
jgi:hypothetical protein